MVPPTGGSSRRRSSGSSSTRTLCTQSRRKRSSTAQSGRSPQSSSQYARETHVESAHALSEGISQLEGIIERLSKLKSGDGSVHEDDARNWLSVDAVAAMTEVIDENPRPSLEYALGVLGAPQVPKKLVERQRSQGARAFTSHLRNRAIRKKREAMEEKRRVRRERKKPPVEPRKEERNVTEDVAAKSKEGRGHSTEQERAVMDSGNNNKSTDEKIGAVEAKSSNEVEAKVTLGGNCKKVQNKIEAAHQRVSERTGETVKGESMSKSSGSVEADLSGANKSINGTEDLKAVSTADDVSASNHIGNNETVGGVVPPPKSFNLRENRSSDVQGPDNVNTSGGVESAKDAKVVPIANTPPIGESDDKCEKAGADSNKHAVSVMSIHSRVKSIETDQTLKAKRGYEAVTSANTATPVEGLSEPADAQSAGCTKVRSVRSSDKAANVKTDNRTPNIEAGSDANDTLDKKSISVAKEDNDTAELKQSLDANIEDLVESGEEIAPAEDKQIKYAALNGAQKISVDQSSTGTAVESLKEKRRMPDSKDAVIEPSIVKDAKVSKSEGGVTDSAMNEKRTGGNKGKNSGTSNIISPSTAVNSGRDDHIEHKSPSPKPMEISRPNMPSEESVQKVVRVYRSGEKREEQSKDNPRGIASIPTTDRGVTGSPGLLKSDPGSFEGKRDESERNTGNEDNHVVRKESSRRQPSESEKQPAESEKQLAEAEKQPAEVDKQPAEVDKQPAEVEKQPAESKNQPAEAEKQLVDSEKQPAKSMRQRTESGRQTTKRSRVEKQAGTTPKAKSRDDNIDPNSSDKEVDMLIDKVIENAGNRERLRPSRFKRIDSPSAGLAQKRQGRIADSQGKQKRHSDAGSRPSGEYALDGDTSGSMEKHVTRDSRVRLDKLTPHPQDDQDTIRSGRGKSDRLRKLYKGTAVEARQPKLVKTAVRGETRIPKIPKSVPRNQALALQSANESRGGDIPKSPENPERVSSGPEPVTGKGHEENSEVGVTEGSRTAKGGMTRRDKSGSSKLEKMEKTEKSVEAKEHAASESNQKRAAAEAKEERKTVKSAKEPKKGSEMAEKAALKLKTSRNDEMESTKSRKVKENDKEKAQESQRRIGLRRVSQFRESPLESSSRRTRLRRESSHLRDPTSLPPDTDPFIIECYHVWKDMNQDKITIPFRKPVTKKDAPGYFDVIKHPMDLSTVQQHLEDKTIKTPKDFYNEMMLICSNATTFNDKETDLYELAVELREKIREAMKPVLKEWRKSVGSKKKVDETVEESQLNSVGQESSGQSGSEKQGSASQASGGGSGVSGENSARGGLSRHSSRRGGSVGNRLSGRGRKRFVRDRGRFAGKGGGARRADSESDKDEDEAEDGTNIVAEKAVAKGRGRRSGKRSVKGPPTSGVKKKRPRAGTEDDGEESRKRRRFTIRK